MIFNGLDQLSTGPGPRSFAGPVLISSGPVFWTMQIYWDRSRSRSLLAGAKNRTGPDFQTLVTPSLCASNRNENGWGGVNPSLSVSNCNENGQGGINPSPCASNCVENGRGGINPSPCANWVNVITMLPGSKQKGLASGYCLCPCQPPCPICKKGQRPTRVWTSPPRKPGRDKKET